MAISTASIRNAWVSKESEQQAPADFLPDWTVVDEEVTDGDDS
jgi:hypothetical protein